MSSFLSRLTPTGYTNFLKNTKEFTRVLNKVKVISAGNGTSLAEMKVEEEHTGHNGELHGGLVATMVDMLSAYTVYTVNITEEKPLDFVSIDMNYRFLATAKTGDEIIIESKVSRRGKNLVFLTVDIRNKLTEELVAKGSHTTLFLSK